MQEDKLSPKSSAVIYKQSKLLPSLTVLGLTVHDSESSVLVYKCHVTKISSKNEKIVYNDKFCSKNYIEINLT